MHDATIITLTKAQYNVLWQLEQHNTPAAHFKPATLGFLCAKKMVDVVNGIAKMTNEVLYFSNTDDGYKAKIW